MQIVGLSPVLQQSLLAALPRLTDAFDVAGTERASPPPVPVPIAPGPSMSPPTTSVQMLVTLAAAEPAIERRRKAAAEADRGLSLLERLQAELVAGPVDPERLHELAAWSENLVLPGDPKLAMLAREVELRVRVELAKHELRA